MALPQISESDYAEKGVRVQDNPMQMAAATAQRIFDELALDVIIPKVNAISDAQDIINADIEGRTSTLETDIDTKADTTSVLTKTNATAFTPTSDYQPATKRYVDLNVISGGVPQTRTINGYSLDNDIVLTADDVGALDTDDASSTTPEMDGVGAVGTSTNYARADHVHPRDTSKLDVPSRITSGTSITLADNTEYELTNVTTLTFTYPSGNFECWIKLTTASEGTITITLPTSSYIGYAPTFGNGETWEISIKDSVVIAQKVGSGS
jgi:hypothetical protein